MGELNRDMLERSEVEVIVENTLDELNKSLDREAIMAGCASTQRVDDIVQFEMARLIAEGTAEGTAESTVIAAFKDHKARAAAIDAFRAAHPAMFIAPAKPKDSFATQYKAVVKKQSTLKATARLMGRIQGQLDAAKAKRGGK